MQVGQTGTKTGTGARPQCDCAGGGVV